MKTSSSIILTAAALLSQASAFSVGPSNIRPYASSSSATTTTSLNAEAAANPITDFFAAIEGFFSSSTTKKVKKAIAAAAPEPEPVDISIPYDSAARLAFGATGLDGAMFGEFQPLYVTKTVADVTVKKMARDLLAMEEVAAKANMALEGFGVVAAKEE